MDAGKRSIANRRNGDSLEKDIVADLHEKPKNYLGEEEIKQLLLASKKSRNPERNYALLLMMYRHGLRVSEAINIRIDDVNFGQARVWINRLKNGLSVEHPINGDELRAIKRYLNKRKDLLPWLSSVNTNNHYPDTR